MTTKQPEQKQSEEAQGGLVLNDYSLGVSQRTRRECLIAARGILATTKNGVFTGSGGEVPVGRSVVDLVELATYIDTGDLPASVRVRNDRARLVSEFTAEDAHESKDGLDKLVDGLRAITAAEAGA